ncbi:MAG TPA: MgtC/SapB family protein [Chloroflexota bacterium]|nr:MgtC/SapB family protein [Chloroflexota bacterium]
MGLPTTLDLALTLQIALAGLLAGVIGWQRHQAGRPAGIRTHALVAMASAIFTIAGIHGFSPSPSQEATRIAAQVVTGIGFLGAGTIFRAENQVFGLTTAATLWYSAALGILVGAGLPWIAIFATVLALVTLVIIAWFEKPTPPRG